MGLSYHPDPIGLDSVKRDLPGAGIGFVDTGHFALETHAEGIAAAIDEFLASRG